MKKYFEISFTSLPTIISNHSNLHLFRMINDLDVFAVFSLFLTNKHHFQPIDHFTDNIPIVLTDVISLPKYLKCNRKFFLTLLLPITLVNWSQLTRCDTSKIISVNCEEQKIIIWLLVSEIRKSFNLSDQRKDDWFFFH